MQSIVIKHEESIVYSFSLSKNILIESPLGKYFDYGHAMAAGWHMRL